VSHADFAHPASRDRLRYLKNPETATGQAGHGDILHQLAADARRL
jgi:hypothetical protein